MNLDCCSISAVLLPPALIYGCIIFPEQSHSCLLLAACLALGAQGDDVVDEYSVRGHACAVP